MPDNKKQTSHGPKKGITAAKADTFDRGQQLSDKEAAAVSRGKRTYAQAMSRDKANDAKKSKTTHVGNKTRSSSQGLASKTAYKKAKYKLDANGNKVAY